MCNEQLDSKVCLTKSQAPELTPLVAAAVEMGWEINREGLIVPRTPTIYEILSGTLPRYKKGQRGLPQGHHYHHDCKTEQEARLLAWLIRKFPRDCWFLTTTFARWRRPSKRLVPCGLPVKHQRYAGRETPVDAETAINCYLGRLNQAYKDITGAASLIIIRTSELQQREVIHYHLLIYGIQLGSLSRKSWEQRWLNSTGGFAANYEAMLKAAPYLVKHQTRRHGFESNLDMGGALRGITPPAGIARCCVSSNGDGTAGVESLAGSRLEGFGRDVLGSEDLNTSALGTLENSSQN